MEKPKLNRDEMEAHLAEIETTPELKYWCVYLNRKVVPREEWEQVRDTVKTVQFTYYPHRPVIKKEILAEDHIRLTFEKWMIELKYVDGKIIQV